MRRSITTLSIFLLALAISGVASPRAYAQDARCFPATGYCLSGRFRQFWEQNGGLPVFGYPLTNEFTQDGRAVQYFERQRFELHPENQPPYDVLLGRLGDEALRRQGIDWQTLPRASGPAAGCRYFPETQHNVCDQEPGVGFLTFWTAHGLEFDRQAGSSDAESLALFGYPISEPSQYTTSSGETILAQWFERARFEWHPNNLAPYQVLLGRLGAELQPAPPAQAAYNNPNSPVDLLASYYNAIDRQEYQRAYDYWQNPPSDYDTFVRGYADTASVLLIVRPPTRIDVGAGNAYAQIPTVLVASRTDGSAQTFAGCYTAHKINIQPSDTWHLSRATIAPVTSDASIPALLARACTS